MEVLLKQQSIEIDLFPDKIDLEINIKEIWEELIKIKEKINKIDTVINEIERTKILGSRIFILRVFVLFG